MSVRPGSEDGDTQPARRLAATTADKGVHFVDRAGAAADRLPASTLPKCARLLYRLMPVFADSEIVYSLAQKVGKAVPGPSG